MVGVQRSQGVFTRASGCVRLAEECLHTRVGGCQARRGVSSHARRRVSGGRGVSSHARRRVSGSPRSCPRKTPCAGNAKVISHVAKKTPFSQKLIFLAHTWYHALTLTRETLFMVGVHRCMAHDRIFRPAGGAPRHMPPKTAVRTHAHICATPHTRTKQPNQPHSLLWSTPSARSTATLAHNINLARAVANARNRHRPRIVYSINSTP